MGEEIKRIRFNRLSSENNIFDEIVFHDGINLILGEKYDESTTRGRKTNGVGKSMSIEFLDFCLLSDYDKSRIARIPEEIFPYDEDVILDMEIGGEAVSIKRNRKNADKPIIIRNGTAIGFKKLQDAKAYMTELIFSELTGKEVPSFRTLLSVLIRDEKSQFADILKCHDLSKRIPDDLTTHLFMLGISLESYKRVLNTIGDIEKNSVLLNKVKNEITENGSKKMADVKAEINALEGELLQLEEAMDSFKTNDAFNMMETELVELENILTQLRQRQKVLKREYEKIKTLPKPEQVDDSEIELVYNQFKENLGTAVVKTLNEVVGFKNRVEEFQRVLVNQKAKELENQLSEIAKQIRTLDDQYAEKIKVIDKKGVLRNLKTSLKIYEGKRDAFAHTQFLFDQYDSYDKQQKRLKLQKSQELMEIDSEIDALRNELKAFMATISNTHEAIMGNMECSFEVKTKNTARGKTPVDISLRIFDDGSHSVDRTKVFIYDMSLLFNEYTRQRHPLFLVHDNIFDVDQDTLVQCLNFAYKQEERFSDFQYILTLNRDKIENEERLRLINMDVDAHRVAVFTKESKFLKHNYQEK
ncbi:MAG: DUF2326 domain-containing protein [Lachnospiraceae bacterium]|nr:DUF2326 domain-containing protein [Lachnospiraceae bacterium]